MKKKATYDGYICDECGESHEWHFYLPEEPKNNKHLTAEYLNTAIYAIQMARDTLPPSDKRRMLKLISKWLYILRGD